MRSKHSISYKIFVLLAILSSENPARCNPITNSNLNDHIRDFSLKDDNNNSTRIKTLQKEPSGRYANFAPVHNPVRFKESSDNVLSSSSYSRGLLQHGHPGYALHDYEDGPPIGYGHEYHIQDFDHAHHSFEHHAPDHYYGHHGGHHHVKHHHKYYDHALAAKTILWPIAGIALLGAAAALVSNPVLLQLGVVSGKRKRRDTEENFEPEIDLDPSWLKKKPSRIEEQSKPIWVSIKKTNSDQSDKVKLPYEVPNYNSYLRSRVSRKVHSNVKQEPLFNNVHTTILSPIEDGTRDLLRQYSGSKELKENKLIPVPLIKRDNT